MSFFKKLKEFFAGPSDEIDDEQESIAKQTISNYRASSQPETKPQETLAQKVQNQQAKKQYTEEPPVVPDTPRVKQSAPAEPSVSEVVEHQYSNAPLTRLELLVDALDLDARKIVLDRGVVTIPFDASGCDFDTKRQLAAAVADEYHMDYNTPPSGIACTEICKKIFSCLKGVREECFACGSFFVSVSTDIDSEGYITSELTNVANGNSVFFDIPAEVKNDGSFDIDYELICTNFMIARNRVINHV